MAIEFGVARAINETNDLKICKLQLIRALQEEKFLAPEFSIEVVDCLALVLRGDNSKTVVQKKKDKQTNAESNMVRVLGGTFIMGSPDNEPERDSNEIQHKVTVNPFYMGKYPVTQIEYKEVMGINPSYFKGDNLPVEMVNWFDTVEYCNKLSQKERLMSAYTINGSGDSRTVSCNWNANGYRLPTEAEWEYACRSGTATPFSTGNNITTSLANYDGDNPYNNNSRGEYQHGPTPVGNFAPNSWGLYDMHGNVWEWCWDWYGDYSIEDQTDPKGTPWGFDHVKRGGCWDSHARYLRSAYRGHDSPLHKILRLGFRIVRHDKEL